MSSRAGLNMTAEIKILDPAGNQIVVILSSVTEVSQFCSISTCCLIYEKTGHKIKKL
jgi:hypothetical protein